MSNSEKKARLLFLKYFGITVLILVIVPILLNLFLEVKSLDKLIFNESINIYSLSFIVIFTGLIYITFKVSGKVGKQIIEEQKDSFKTTFIGIVSIWMLTFLLAALLESITRSNSIGEFFLGILIWIFPTGIGCLLLGSIHGLMTSYFLGKEIENKTYPN